MSQLVGVYCKALGTWVFGFGGLGFGFSVGFQSLGFACHDVSAFGRQRSELVHDRVLKGGGFRV